MKPQLIAILSIVGVVATAGAAMAVNSDAIVNSTPSGSTTLVLPVSETSPLPTSKPTTKPTQDAESSTSDSTSEASEPADDDSTELAETSDDSEAGVSDHTESDDQHVGGDNESDHEGNDDHTGEHNDD